jgi:GT2 family glycosyltransferase
MKRSVYAILVNWNGKDDTLVCLESLKKVKVPKNVELSVVVVDNGSSNDSIDVISKKHPWVKLIPTGKNLGFTGGNNVGFQYAIGKGAQYVWMLNNDTYVDPHVLSFLDVFDNPSIGAVGSKIYFAAGHEFHHDRYKENERGKVIWYAGGLVDWNNMYASHRGVDEIDHGQYDTMEDTPFITGCSFVMRTDVMSTVGMLDETYYLYLEDLDLSLRIQRAGYRTVYAPASVVWHVNAGSSGRPGNPVHEYYITRNRLIVGMRYAPLRTKFALLREAIKFLFTGSGVRKRAVVDWMLHKYGKQYEPVRKA